GLRIARIGPGRLIGVEPDIAVELGAARGGITGKVAQIGTHQIEHAAHDAASSRTATALACAPRPSARASVNAHGPMTAIPSALTACTLIWFWKLATLTPL